MALTRRQKRQRRQPVTDNRPCSTEKKRRVSNVLKRLGKTGAINFYAERQTSLTTQRLFYKTSIKELLHQLQTIEFTQEILLEKRRKLNSFRWELQNVNNKLERTRRFMDNLRYERIREQDRPYYHD